MQVNDHETADPRDVEDLALLEEAARRAGDIALTFFGGDPKTWFKGNKSPVSEADMEVDGYLAEVLRLARPEYGWLSEESADTADRLGRDRVFIVDPIDGTRAFLAGGDEWTVSLSVVERGRPVVGVLFCPVREEMFLAARGGGARLNGEPIRGTGTTGISGASLSGPHSVVANQEVLASGFERTRNIRSLAYRLALVASGRVDVAVARAGPSDWDLAAADLLVQEAGGKLTDFAGNALTYNRETTRHPALIAAPVQLITAARANISRIIG
ncbi:MAG: 3'(2'),5'-bisphosphate nucleotidase CysQ [Roseibium sp.]|nr:3'(2'),5'-bisphosphate nucleotidase CysQ [Roseibium sp.]